MPIRYISHVTYNGTGVSETTDVSSLQATSSGTNRVSKNISINGTKYTLDPAVAYADPVPLGYYNVFGESPLVGIVYQYNANTTANFNYTSHQVFTINGYMGNFSLYDEDPYTVSISNSALASSISVSNVSITNTTSPGTDVTTHNMLAFDVTTNGSNTATYSGNFRIRFYSNPTPINGFEPASYVTPYLNIPISIQRTYVSGGGPGPEPGGGYNPNDYTFQKVWVFIDQIANINPSQSDVDYALNDDPNMLGMPSGGGSIDIGEDDSHFVTVTYCDNFQVALDVLSGGSMGGVDTDLVNDPMDAKQLIIFYFLDYPDDMGRWNDVLNACNEQVGETHIFFFNNNPGTHSFEGYENTTVHNITTNINKSIVDTFILNMTYVYNTHMTSAQGFSYTFSSYGASLQAVSSNFFIDEGTIYTLYQPIDYGHVGSFALDMESAGYSGMVYSCFGRGADIAFANSYPNFGCIIPALAFWDMIANVCDKTYDFTGDPSVAFEQVGIVPSNSGSADWVAPMILRYPDGSVEDYTNM